MSWLEQPSHKPPRLMSATPDQLPEALGRLRPTCWVLGDACLAPALALPAVALYAAAYPQTEFLFWGRRAGFHEDRFCDLLEGRETRTHYWSNTRFDPIDFLDAAEWIAQPTGADALTLMALDEGSALDEGLLNAVETIAEVTPLSIWDRRIAT